MSDINKYWRSVFSSLSGVNPLPQWTMSNGAIFQMIVPKASLILKNGFDKEIEWPFEFAEIDQIEIKSEIEIGSETLKNDLAFLLQELRHVENLNYTISPTKLLIRGI